MRPTDEARHARAIAAGDARLASAIRYEARAKAERRGVPAPQWASPRRAAPASAEPRAIAALPPHLEIPDYARRWRSSAGAGACVRVNPSGVELSYFDESKGQRVAAFVAHDRFTTENAAAYALAQGAIRFAPLGGRGVKGPGSASFNAPPGHRPARPADASEDAAE